MLTNASYWPDVCVQVCIHVRICQDMNQEMFLIQVRWGSGRQQKCYSLECWRPPSWILGIGLHLGPRWRWLAAGRAAFALRTCTHKEKRRQVVEYFTLKNSNQLIPKQSASVTRNSCLYVCTCQPFLSSDDKKHIGLLPEKCWKLLQWLARQKRGKYTNAGQERQEWRWLTQGPHGVHARAHAITGMLPEILPNTQTSHSINILPRVSVTYWRHLKM